MKYTYAFATGNSQVEVPEEWAALLAEMDHEEELHNRRETRRHQSLDDLVYEGLDFAAEGDAEDALMKAEEEKSLREAIGLLPEVQQRRVRMYMAGLTYLQIGDLEHVSFQKVGVSIDKAKRNIRSILAEG